MTVAAAVEWATTPTTDPRSTVGPRRMTAVRGFARYLAGIDPATEVPPLGLMPQPAAMAAAVHLLTGRHRRVI